MSNLNTRPVLHPKWVSFALPTLAGFHACVIAIFDPRNGSPATPEFDPYRKTPTSGNTTPEPRLVWQGEAQLQKYRQALTMDDVAGSVSQVRSVRIEIPLDSVAEPIRKGFIVRVIDDPRTPASEVYEYTVTSGLDSPLAWKRTIEAESDQSVVAGPITQYEVTP